MNPVGWFEIYVDDMARAVAFYETMLGIRLSKLDAPSDELTMMAFPMEMSGPGCPGALVKMDGMKAGGNSVLVYFNSDDCAIEAARIQGAGGALMKPKFSIGPYGFIALGTDSEGNAFGLHSLK